MRVCSIAMSTTSRLLAGGEHGHPAVEQLGEDQRLAGPLVEPAQAHRAGGEHDGVRVDRGDPADRHEDPPAALDLGDEAEHLRRVGAEAQRDDDVADPADLVAVGVEDGQAGQPGDEDAGRGAHPARLVVGAPRVGDVSTAAPPSRTRSWTCSPTGRSPATRWRSSSAPTSCRPRQMQTLAREFNLSETVFVLPPGGGDLPGCGSSRRRRAAVRRAPERRRRLGAAPARPASGRRRRAGVRRGAAAGPRGRRPRRRGARRRRAHGRGPGRRHRRDADRRAPAGGRRAARGRRAGRGRPARPAAPGRLRQRLHLPARRGRRGRALPPGRRRAVRARAAVRGSS